VGVQVQRVVCLEATKFSINNGIFISHDKCLKDILEKFEKEKAKGLHTLTHTSNNLNLDEDGNPMDHKLSRSMIGWFFVVSFCIWMRYHDKGPHVCTVSTIAKRVSLVAVNMIIRCLVLRATSMDEAGT
jgi:hypothetical protein